MYTCIHVHVYTCIYSTLTFLDFDKDRNVINEASMISGRDSDYRNGTMNKWKNTGKIYWNNGQMEEYW